MKTAWAIDRAPRRRIAARRWDFTVSIDLLSRFAVSTAVSPTAAPRRTSSSEGVSFGARRVGLTVVCDQSRELFSIRDDLVDRRPRVDEGVGQGQRAVADRLVHRDENEARPTLPGVAGQEMVAPESVEHCSPDPREGVGAKAALARVVAAGRRDQGYPPLADQVVSIKGGRLSRIADGARRDVDEIEMVDHEPRRG